MRAYPEELSRNGVIYFKWESLPTRVSLRSHWQSRLRPGSCLADSFALHHYADERSTPASAYCLSAVTFLRYLMSSPWRSWCGCRWCPLISLPMSPALLCIMFAARLYRGLCPLESWTCWTVGLLQEIATNYETNRLDLAMWCPLDLSYLYLNSEIFDVPIPNVST